MDQKSRQEALNSLSSEDLEKIKAHQASTDGAMPVDREWMLAAEFAMTFGWGAYKDFKSDNIRLDEMLTLIEAARKLKAIADYENTTASFIGSVSARAKKPLNAFKKATKDMVKKTKVND